MAAHAGLKMSLQRTKSAIISWAGSNDSYLYLEPKSQHVSNWVSRQTEDQENSGKNSSGNSYNNCCSGGPSDDRTGQSRAETAAGEIPELFSKFSTACYVVIRAWACWKNCDQVGIIFRETYEPGHEKICLMPYANNKCADQPAHPRSLINAFVVRCLDSVMSLVSVIKISSLLLSSVAEQASLSLTWSETPEDTFSHDKAHIDWVFYDN